MMNLNFHVYSRWLSQIIKKNIQQDKICEIATLSINICYNLIEYCILFRKKFCFPEFFSLNGKVVEVVRHIIPFHAAVVLL